MRRLGCGERGGALKHSAGLLVGLLVAWALWSGYWDNVLLVTLGILSSVFVLVLARRMNLVDPEGVPLHLTLGLLTYAPWLVWEVVKANFDVARRILAPGLPISPTVIEVRATQRTELGRVVYANSITLTPGTVSIDVEEETIRVHALTREAADGVETGDMDKRVTRLEGGA